jgi:hypothetical protein
VAWRAFELENVVLSCEQRQNGITAHAKPVFLTISLFDIDGSIRPGER